MRNAIALAMLVAGLATASPAFARPPEPAIDCPPQPPMSDIARKGEGGLAVQFLGLSANASRTHETSESDVIIRKEGKDSAIEVTLIRNGCLAIIQQYKGDVSRQAQEYEKLVDRRRSMPVKAEIGALANAFQGGTGACLTCGPLEVSTSETTSSPAKVQPVAKAPTLSPLALRKANDALDAALGGAGCNGGICPVSSVPTVVHFASATPQEPKRTCTTSAPVILQSPPIAIGNMLITGMPITLGGGDTSCTTTW